MSVPGAHHLPDGSAEQQRESVPPGFYSYADVRAQLRWWNGSTWEDRWQQVPAPGHRFTWGTGNGRAQVIGGSVVAGFMGVLLLLGLLRLFAIETAVDVLIAGLGVVAPLLMLGVAVVVIVNGNVALQRKRDRERVGSF
ncbi:hypothetical protein [Leucobacter massiliensis]|uniref:DUF2510 domain-containing protein n=1 Tax=Leucobacter massiliensis TaxID=1686285 RepID=A0A2S9QM97_9MICO|nr:hypothetical protein [Leucobacter massiliensis]PRI10707.1 hypothetical protein B4915_07330 [Leucobacter massiliensis]